MKRNTHHSSFTTHHSSLVPRLRFPEFRNAGPWEVKRLGEVCDTFSGGTPASSHKEYYGGSIPFIRSAEIDSEVTELHLTEAGLHNSSAKLVRKGDILIALYGANSGEAAIARIDGAINQAILCVRSQFNHHFILNYWLLMKRSITLRYLQGGQGNLSGEIVTSIEMPFPALPEQQKIADCLSSLDELIELQAKKLEALKAHKKGLMQQLFPREGETTPRLRFPEFRNAGPWERYSLADIENRGWIELGRGQVISQIDIKEHPGSYPVYSSSIKNNGIMGKYGLFMFDEELITWSIDGGGDFFYRPKHKFSVTNVCGYLRADTSLLNTRFIAYQLQIRHASLTFDYQFKAHPSVIRKLYTMNIPSLPEQQKIADCLSSLDELIELQAKKLEALKAQKKGLMQQLFPQEISA